MSPLLALFALVAHAEPTARQLKAEALAQRAHAELDAGALGSALADAVKAQKKDSDNVTAHFVMARLLLLAAAQGGADREALTARARAEYTFVLEHDPDGILGGIARGWLTGGMDSRPSLDRLPTACPPEATDAFDEAEAAFQRRDLDAAQKRYTAALSACPANSQWFVYAGDAWYATGDVEGARAHYQEAIRIDDCDWQAHRFLADLELSAGPTAEVIPELVRSLACNPTYSEGRGALSGIARNAGLPYAWPDAPAQALQADLPEPWRTLSTSRTMALTDAATRLDAERAGVRAALVVWRQHPSSDPVWVLLDDAERAGTLDAAIFALLLDRPLFDAFRAWRADHRAELETYIRTKLVGVP